MQHVPSPTLFKSVQNKHHPSIIDAISARGQFFLANQNAQRVFTIMQLISFLSAVALIGATPLDLDLSLSCSEAEALTQFSSLQEDVKFTGVSPATVSSAMLRGWWDLAAELVRDCKHRNIQIETAMRQTETLFRKKATALNEVLRSRQISRFSQLRLPTS